MATKRVKAHKKKGRPVKAYTQRSTNASPVHKPSKPHLRVEGPDAAALLRSGLNVGAPVTLTVKGYVEEAEAHPEKPSYGPQHSLKICADRIEAPAKKKGKE